MNHHRRGRPGPQLPVFTETAILDITTPRGLRARVFALEHATRGRQVILLVGTYRPDDIEYGLLPAIAAAAVRRSLRIHIQGDDDAVTAWGDQLREAAALELGVHQ